MGDFLAGFLAGRGWEVEKTPVPQPRGERDRRPALECLCGAAGARRRIWFFPRTWIRFRPTFRSAKMRSSCMGAEFPTPRASSPRRLRRPKRCARRGFGLDCCLCQGEERDSAGAKAANLAPKGSRFLINGEPTDNRLALASKGALRVAFRATGKMAHSAYPELGESAVHKLVQVMAKLLELELPVTEDVGPEHAEYRADSRRPRAQRDCGQGRGAGAGAAGGRFCAGARGDPGSCGWAWRKWTSRWRFPLCACARWRVCLP